MTTTDHPPTLGVLLAGGLSRRMGGGDKGLKRVGGETIIARVIARLGPQCAGLVVNANGDPTRLAFLDLPIVPDGVPGFAGPLAGVLAALDWAARVLPDIAWVASAPTDCPFLPHDLVAQLHGARAAARVPLACARSAGQTHPPVGLWPVALRGDLRHALTVENERKIDRWTARHSIAYADWSATPVDPFFNANAPADLAVAEALLQAHSGL